MKLASIRLMLITGFATALVGCASTSMSGGSSGGGMPMPPGGGTPSPGGGTPSPGGGTPSPGGGIPSPGGADTGLPPGSPGGAGGSEGDEGVADGGRSGAGSEPDGSGGSGSGGAESDGSGSTADTGGAGDGSQAGSAGADGAGDGQQAGSAGADGGGDGQQAGGSGAGEEDVFGGNAAGDSRTAGSGAEDEFDRALGDFDSVIAEEQGAIARTVGGSAADEVLSDAAGTEGSGVAGDPLDTDPRQEGGMNREPSGAPRERTVQQVEGCDDSDTVARQLCEAATQEQDPFLRAALWDEYTAYKSILGRQ